MRLSRAADRPDDVPAGPVVISFGSSAGGGGDGGTWHGLGTVVRVSRPSMERAGRRTRCPSVQYRTYSKLTYRACPATRNQWCQRGRTPDHGPKVSCFYPEWERPETEEELITADGAGGQRMKFASNEPPPHCVKCGIPRLREKDDRRPPQARFSPSGQNGRPLSVVRCPLPSRSLSASSSLTVVQTWLTLLGAPVQSTPGPQIRGAPLGNLGPCEID